MRYSSRIRSVSLKGGKGRICNCPSACIYQTVRLGIRGGERLSGPAAEVLEGGDVLTHQVARKGSLPSFYVADASVFLEVAQDPLLSLLLVEQAFPVQFALLHHPIKYVTIRQAEPPKPRQEPVVVIPRVILPIRVSHYAQPVGYALLLEAQVLAAILERNHVD